MSILSWENGASYTQAVSWLKIIFQYKRYLWKLNWKPKGSQNLLCQSFSFTQRDRARSQRRDSWWTSMFLKNLEEQSHCPSAEQTCKWQLPCCAAHLGGMGQNGGFWSRIKVTKLSLRQLLCESLVHYRVWNSMCPVSIATSYLLSCFLNALASHSAFSPSLNLSAHHSVSSLPSDFPQVSWQQRVVCAMFELQTCVWTPVCQQPANSLKPFLLYLHGTLPSWWFLWALVVRSTSPHLLCRVTYCGCCPGFHYHQGDGVNRAQNVVHSTSG